MIQEILTFDMHVHSKYSYDSILSLKQIEKKSKKYNIYPIICDHNSIEGSLRYNKNKLFNSYLNQLILAEEITTKEGEILGIFLSDFIPPNLSAEETLELIHEQGAIGIIPHPSDRYRHNSMSYKDINSIKNKIDGIECYNSRTLSNLDRQYSIKYAQKNNLPITGGSDAHSYYELFKTIVQIYPFDNPKEFLLNLKKSKIYFQRSFPLIHITSTIRLFNCISNEVK
jgi:predicted metal-dependent phosphoesterase TrpH